MTDDTDDDRPALVRMGANTRDAPSGYNLDVSGTPGPDHLGQETVDVDGHHADRPGVRSRLPESTHGVDQRIRRMDTGEELPVLLSSSMRPGPIEGTQGSHTQIVEGECARCGYDRLKVTVATLPGETQESCMACGAKQGRRYDDGYRMPTTDKERADAERDNGQHIASLTTRAALDMEPDTGMGPYISLVSDRSVTRLRKDDVADLFFALAENGDIDLVDEVQRRYTALDTGMFGAALLPDGITIARDDDE